MYSTQVLMIVQNCASSTELCFKGFEFICKLSRRSRAKSIMGSSLISVTNIRLNSIFLNALGFLKFL